VDGEVQGPAGAHVVEGGQLLDGEGAAQATAQLGDEEVDDAPQDGLDLGRRRLDAPLPGLPLLDVGLERQ
jgi:hypothetical protein